VIRYKISHNPVGRIEISVHHDYIGEILYLPVRIRFIILNITHTLNKTHQKWQIGSLKSGGLAIRDAKMRWRKMVLFRCRGLVLNTFHRNGLKIGWKRLEKDLRQTPSSPCYAPAF
jgi:hypothetical protein